MTASGHAQWEHPALTACWQKGQVVVSDLTPASAAYICGYVLKKAQRAVPTTQPNYKSDQDPRYRRISEHGEEYYVQPEYTTMSRNPGIGHDWFKKYSGDVYPDDFIVHSNVKYRPPAYYDKLLEKADPTLLESLKAKRKAAQKDPDPERLRASEVISFKKQDTFTTRRI